MHFTSVLISVSVFVRVAQTDAIDSWLIAEFVRQKRHLLRAFEPESRASMLVRALNRERSSLVTQRTRILNKIEALPACLGGLYDEVWIRV